MNTVTQTTKATVERIEIPLQPAAEDIWQRKYQLKNKQGEAIDLCVEGTFTRVARALADIESTPEKQQKWYEKFLWALKSGAVPAGRIISNAGAQQYKPATSTINCTVSGTIEDSMDDILQKVHEAGMTLKSGAGIGYEFSTLRPNDAYVSGSGALTSGPLSFMDIYDKVCFTISSAGGRRGAQMATFDVGHPDVLDFIRAKREDGRLRQFNLSLLITSEFMEAVKNETLWPLAFPVTIDEAETHNINLQDTDQVIWRDWPITDGYIKNDAGKVACRIYRTIDAGKLWNVIMTSTYEYAEPGFILIDEYNEMNNNWFCENIRTTNPCVTADTWVQTSAGPRQVLDLIGHSFSARIDGVDFNSGGKGFFKTATKEIVHLQTTEGYSLKLTADHRVRRVSRFTRYSTDTQWCEAGKLQTGDRVLLNDHRENAEWPGKYSNHEGYLIGLLLGDGTLKKDEAVLSVWKTSVVVNGSPAGWSAGTDAVMQAALLAATSLPHRADFKGWSEIAGRNEYRLSTAAIRDIAFDLGMSAGNKTVTSQIERTSSDFYKGFLRGLFDADGSVQGSQSKGVSIRLAQSDECCLQAVQRMLLRLGITSVIYRNRRQAGTSILPDGKGGKAEYDTLAQHELVISGENLRRYYDLVGFADSDKLKKLQHCLSSYKRTLNRERFTARVSSVTRAGVADVYDVQVPGINTFDANGLHAHNCGEQGLPEYGACLLGSINLTHLVKQPFTDNASFDWDTYREVVKVFTRMLDNVVEINGLPLEQQRNEIVAKRRHGMGYLGLGSALTMMGVRYGSEESLIFTEKVTKELALAGWEAALELAKEKGPAPILEQDFAVTSEMLSRRPEMKKDGWQVGDNIKGKVLHAKYSRYMQKVAEVNPKLVAELEKTGARFTHHSSIAPTGTIALSIGNNVSNGIEPSFAHHYSRNIIREGKKSKENVDVWSFELLAYRELINQKAKPYSDEADEKLPEYFISADDVTPKQHVDIQAAAQKWIDSSISKTANIPTDFPYDEFKDIYLYAYEKKLKGCTTFRFNPEVFQGVLVKESDLENTTYRFSLDDGSFVEAKGNEEINYDGEMHTAANLYDALKEGYYGKF
jgi:ribonucleoside-diphosphate reductase alpha chain